MRKLIQSQICLIVFCYIFNVNTSTSQEITRSTSKGLTGYIASSSAEPPEGYDMCLGFYSAVWNLTPNPVLNFQIGLPATCLLPENRDNLTEPLCPIGTIARDNWPG